MKGIYIIEKKGDQHTGQQRKQFDMIPGQEMKICVKISYLCFSNHSGWDAL